MFINSVIITSSVPAVNLGFKSMLCKISVLDHACNRYIICYISNLVHRPMYYEFIYLSLLNINDV